MVKNFPSSDCVFIDGMSGGNNVGLGGKIATEMDCCKLVKDSDMGFVGATYNPHNQHCYGEIHYGFKENNHPKGWKMRTTLGNPNAMKRKIFETIFTFYLMSIYKISLLILEKHNYYFLSSNTSKSDRHNRRRGIGSCRSRASANTGRSSGTWTSHCSTETTDWSSSQRFVLSRWLV